jgi:hypothetical protein
MPGTHPSSRLRSRASEPQGQHPQPKDEATHRIHSLFRLRMHRDGFALAHRAGIGVRGGEEGGGEDGGSEDEVLHRGLSRNGA